MSEQEKYNIGDKIVVDVIKANKLEDLARVNPKGLDLYEYQLNSYNRPQFEPNSMNKDRTKYTGNPGIIKSGLIAERKALIGELTNLLSEIQKINPEINMNDIDNLRYIPNARFSYFNKLIKHTLAGKLQPSKTELDYVDTVWMNPQAKTSVKKFLLSPKNEQKLPPVLPLIPSRNPIDLQGISGDQIVLSNPGVMRWNQEKESTTDTSFAENILQILDEQIQRLVDQAQLNINLEGLNMSSPQSELNKNLTYFRDKLLDRHLTYEELVKQVNAISLFIGAKRSKYLMSLSNPFKHKTARIPTLLSPPSATFSLRSLIPLTTNASGNVAFLISPFFLAASTTNLTSIAVNNNATLLGNASDNFFLGVNVGQVLPADFYVRYRLISAGLRLYCYPSSNNDNGIATVSVTFETMSTVTAPGAIAQAAQFGDFSQIENGYYKQTTTVASRQVQEHSYIPLDESFWDYQAMSSLKPGFAWTGYITGAAPSTTIARVELILNFEALLDNQYTDYLPSESPTAEEDPKNVFMTLGKIKNSEVLTPGNIQQILDEQNLANKPEGEVVLPPSKKETKMTRDILNTVTQLAKDVVKEQASKLPNIEKSNWLEKVMNMLSPVAASIIQSFNPFSGLSMFKF